MAKSLVIVESPAKAKTINKYLGSNYVVKSSIGHIRDLPTSGGGTESRAKPTKSDAPKDVRQRDQLVRRMGVDPDRHWAARYEILPGKEKVVAELKKLAGQADTIYLATDLDREGKPSRGICKRRLVEIHQNIVAWCSRRSLSPQLMPHFRNPL